MSKLQNDIAENIRVFATRYLNDNVAELVPNTTHEQRQPLWDAVITHAINLDASKQQEYAQAIAPACIKLCHAQMPDASESEVEKLYGVVGIVVDELFPELALFCKTQSQNAMEALLHSHPLPNNFVTTR